MDWCQFIFSSPLPLHRPAGAGPAEGFALQVERVEVLSKRQALVYDILPSRGRAPEGDAGSVSLEP